MEQDSTRLKLIPAPVGGWNARDPLHAMPETDAVSLLNYFPDVSNVKPRGGTTKVYETDDHADTITQLFTLGNYLFVLYTDTSAGAQKLARMAIGTYTATDVSGAVTFDSYQYNWTIFKRKIFACNTVTTEAPFKIGESGNAAATGFSGPTMSDLYQCEAHKGRLYFVQLDSSSIWYGALDAEAGTLTEYNIGMFMRKGGYISAVTSTTKQGGDQNETLFVVISSLGEVFVFAGDYPGSVTWELVGRYEVAPPLGPRCFAFKGSDLQLLTLEGIIPMNAILSGQKEGDRYSTISDKISGAWQSVFSQLATVNTNPIYALYAPVHKMFVVDTIGWGVWVQNTLTGAWAKFVDNNGEEGTPGSTPGWSSRMVATGGYLFGRGGANTIVKLETPDSGVTSDYSSVVGADPYPIRAVARQAFSFLDDMANTKHITSVKAMFSLTQDAGHDETQRSIKIGADTDYNDAALTHEMILQDITADGTVHYSVPCDVRAEGTAFSLKYESTFGDGYALALNNFIVAYEVGGFLEQ